MFIIKGAIRMNSQKSRTGFWQLFRIWVGIGLQSFGGGASTTFLIQRTFTEKYSWLTMDELTRFWSLCILTPGINLVALTVLIGRRLGGTRGIVASIAGLLLPSATITCLLTALFTQIEHMTAVQAILRGVIPATGAIMLLVGLNFALPIFRRSYKEGMLYFVGSVVVIVVCLLAVALFKVPVIAVIIGAIVLGAVFFAPKPPSPVLVQKQREQP
jgi:chromate transporter